MGTESEALRWKQWIDRWIKISAPTNSIPSSTSSSKIDPNSSSGPGQRKSLLTTEQLRYQLINMVRVLKLTYYQENLILSFSFFLFFLVAVFRKVILFFVKDFVEKF